MIQRIQSIYLILAFLSSAFIAFLLPLFEGKRLPLELWSYPIFSTFFAGSALLSLVALFRYNKRKQQVLLTRVNIMLNIVLLGGLAYFWYEQFAVRLEALGYGCLLPLAQIILLALALRGILRDELLVKSMDRLR